MKFRIEDIALPEQAQVARMFQCPICLGVLHDPVQTRCEHHFCSECLGQVQGRTCPVCKLVLDASDVKPLKEANMPLYRMMGKIPVQCPHRLASQPPHTDSSSAKRPRTEQTCEWTGSYADLVDLHIGVCRVAPVPCAHCGFEFPRGAIAEHEATCEHRLQTCPICNERMTSESEHMQQAAMTHVAILQAKLAEMEKKHAADKNSHDVLANLAKECKTQRAETAKCAKTTFVSRKIDELSAKVTQVTPRIGDEFRWKIKGVQKLLREYVRGTQFTLQSSHALPFTVFVYPHGDANTDVGCYEVWVESQNEPHFRYEVDVWVGSLKTKCFDVESANITRAQHSGKTSQLRKDAVDDEITVTLVISKVKTHQECTV
eukprot:TRINITY_DN62123_c0_g1_i1.p1 TRINITY_DN62123_c0_g1~~TRINITY_DN62123_c0_g1_i1.p1  ORF type:complete len:374 (+),score=52.61 TRINITY_DN62123_c0_g1_i1:81-1202(+)